MPFGVSIYRTGCPNFIAFVLKKGLEYIEASFNNSYDKHSVHKLGTNSLKPVEVDSPGITVDLQRRNSEKKRPPKLLCLPLRADWMSGFCESGKVALGQCPHAWGSRGRESESRESSQSRFLLKITAQMSGNGWNSFTQACTHCLHGTGQRNATIP